MTEKEQELMIADMEKWAKNKLDEVFELEKFKAIGKENDHVFQALSFLGEASQKLSIARTILKRDDEVKDDAELFEQLGKMQQWLHEFQSYIRTGW